MDNKVNGTEVFLLLRNIQILFGEGKILKISEFEQLHLNYFQSIRISID